MFKDDRGVARGTYVRRVLVAALGLLTLTALALFLCGCNRTTPPALREEIVDLAEDSLNGQWDVQLEIWESGDRTNVYRSQLRFNVTALQEGNSGSNTPSEADYAFSVYRVKEDNNPERFSGVPGFQPTYVDNMGCISVEDSDMIYLWFDQHPEYVFRVYLLKNADGKIVGAGNAITLGEEGETLATMDMTLTRTW